MKKLICLLSLTIVLCFSGQETKAEFFHGFEIQGGMEFPIHLGARGQFNFVNDIYAVVAGGYAPSFITSAMGTVVSTFGMAGEKTATVMGDSLVGAIYLEARGGYRFQGESGYYLEGGVSMMNNGGGESSADDINTAMGTTYSVVTNNAITVKSSLVNLTVHGGYTWKLQENMYIMAEVGIVKPVSSSVDVSSVFNTGAVNNLKNDLKSYLEGEFSGSFMIPTAGAWFSYLF